MKQITKEQRYTIFSLKKQGCTQKFIAEAIGVHKSTISRELRRNVTEKGNYSYKVAQELADIRKLRLKEKRKFTPEVKNRIERYMREKQWSPEQIVGYCKNKGYAMVSVETIYKFIRQDKESGGDLYKHCRFKLKHRKRCVSKKCTIKDRVSIDERPAEVNGSRFGDWEMDTMVDNEQNAILSLIEKHTKYTIVRKLKSKKASHVADTVIAALIPFKRNIHSITTDNGTEFADHKKIADKLNTIVYFAHPYCSWEKGAIENANMLYRQYIPKKLSFKLISKEQLMLIQQKINDRPRKAINFQKPYKLFFVNLQ